VRQNDRAVAGPSNFIADLLALRIVRGRQELRVAADHREEVVEVVGDAAGEQADGVHLLRVAELLLEALQLCDVARDREHVPLAAIVDERSPGVDPAP
jgi:hypothetical protein